MSSITIQEIIPLTIQGEGYNYGAPSSFIRLFGCPVGCLFCDTGYAVGASSPSYSKISFEEIKNTVQSKNIVITGGEPCVNPEFANLVNFLISQGYKISVETSGIRYLDSLNNIWVTLSPKEHLTDKGKLDTNILSTINELKLIITNISDFEYYQNQIYWCKLKNIPVYLQPEWSKRQDIFPLIVDLANKHGLKISNQVHKLIGVL